ncbi:hypothetical protein [Plantactinospora sp. WMMB782]|uniref:hypothetical protein n=1 Tax=Plantactinospora sp. WMMB782 TaxID=3404121 RepID=UPI003B94DD70
MTGRRRRTDAAPPGPGTPAETRAASGREPRLASGPAGHDLVLPVGLLLGALLGSVPVVIGLGAAAATTGGARP